jgi:predicted HicB family RNase H-like nuclease
MEDQESTIELDITDEEFINLAKEAHMQDLTLNQYINNILKNYIETLADF